MAQRTAQEAPVRAAEDAPPATFTNVALDDTDSNDSGSDHPDQEDRNISMESDHLDPEEKAAHEADTLPMDGVGAAEITTGGATGGPPSGRSNLKRALRSKTSALLAPVIREKNPLPTDPSHKDRLLDAWRCPPHGRVGRWSSLALLPFVVWLSCLAALGAVAVPPHGTIFLLIVLVVTALILGQGFQLLKLPPLLGMLIMGIVLKNLPGVDFQDDWKTWSSTLRGLALVIILMRAGLGLDSKALKRLSGKDFKPKNDG